MPTIRLTIEYDGTDYVGWQFQINGRSVQEEVEKAIKQILQADIRITGGGRTDAGVHARGQVASFNIEQDVEIGMFAKSINSVLPHNIVIRGAAEVSKEFNARRDAKSRRYTYYISQVPTAIHRNYCWQVFQKLDFELMRACANQIIGEHGFRSFCKVETDLHQHRCTISSAEWKQKNGLFVFGNNRKSFFTWDGSNVSRNDGQCGARPYKNRRFCKHSGSKRSIRSRNVRSGKRIVLRRNTVLE
jgi:tRNA pseudouridine38-40 synthase